MDFKSKMAKAESATPQTKAGTLFKLGDGPINYNWNQRYIVVERNMLYYYSESSDRTPRGLLPLSNCVVSALHPLKDHSNSFSLQLSSGKRYHFSHLDQAEAENWRNFIEAAGSRTQESLADVAKVEEIAESEVIERRGSIGELPVDLALWMDRVEKVETGTGEEVWKLLSVRQGLRLEACGYEPARVDKMTVGRIVAVWVLLVLASAVTEVPAWLAVLALMMAGWMVRGIVIPGSSDYMRAVTVVDSSPKDIFNALMDLSQRPRWDCMVRGCKPLETQSSHTDVFATVMAPLRGGVLAQMVKPRYTVMKRYWRRNEVDVHYIIQKSVPHQYVEKHHARIDYFEGISIVPLEPGRCKVTFLLSLDAHCPSLLQVWISKARGCSLSGLREFVLQQICEAQAEEEEQITGMHEEQRELDQENPPSVEKSDLVLYGGDEAVSLEVRNPGYTRNKSGGIKCVNKQELDSQKGIVLELLAKAGKQLMEGKHIVGISLPVRIFEPRSTLERMVDWWATAPVYLVNACVAVRLT